MELPLTDILLSDATAKAICWTLIHSLWQGILAAALAGVVIGCTRRRPAVLRYNLLAADGLLFLLAAGATFYYELGQAADMVTTGPLKAASEAANGSVTVLQREMLSRSTTAGNIMQQTGDYLNAHAGIITLIWLACLAVQLMRLTGGLYRLNRIRVHSSPLPPPDDHWNERLLALSRRLGIGRTVTLLQSKWVKAPSAFGFLKPSILVPLGMLSQLPPDQVETILLHELAHIRRGDYLVNLLLHLTEAIFFFNPGMRWIASLIRREREACCDDIVLAGTADRNSYFNALVSFTQWAVDQQAAGRANGRAGEWSYTLQLGGGKTDLLWRIKRMLNQENKKLQVMEKAILSFGLMALVSVSLISMKGKEGRTAPVAKIPGTAVVVVKDTAPQVLRDTFPGKKISFNSMMSHSNSDDGRTDAHIVATDEEGNRYEVRTKDGEVTTFRLNDRLVPREEYGRYANVFASLEAARRNIPKPPVPPRPPTPPTPSTPPAPPAPATPPTPPAPPPPPGWSARNWPATTAEESEGTSVSERAPTRANPLVYTRVPDPYVKSIVADLVENGLIDNLNRFSFVLNADGLVVNGIKQSNDIFLKFRTKYVIHPKAHFIYSQYYTPKGSGSHCSVNTDPDETSI
jgi:bla regulator protein blaR1